MPDACAHISHDALNAHVVVQEGDVLFPRKPYHYPEATYCYGIHQPSGRSCVDAHRVQSGSGDRPEVALDNIPGWELRSCWVRPERPIGYSPDPEMLVGNKQELAVHAGALHFAAPPRLSLVRAVGCIALERTRLRVPRRERDAFDRCDGHARSTFAWSHRVPYWQPWPGRRS